MVIADITKQNHKAPFVQHLLLRHERANAAVRSASCSSSRCCDFSSHPHLHRDTELAGIEGVSCDVLLMHPRLKLGVLVFPSVGAVC